MSGLRCDAQEVTSRERNGLRLTAHRERLIHRRAGGVNLQLKSGGHCHVGYIYRNIAAHLRAETGAIDDEEALAICDCDEIGRSVAEREAHIGNSNADDAVRNSAGGFKAEVAAQSVAENRGLHIVTLHADKRTDRQVERRRDSCDIEGFADSGVRVVDRDAQ